MDQRYYLSLLMMTAVFAVAWVMSQFSDDSLDSRLTKQSSNSSPLENSSTLTDETELAPQDGNIRRSLVAAQAQPLIPGLLDDSGHNFNGEQTRAESARVGASAGEHDSATDSHPEPTASAKRDLTGVPLRPVSSAVITSRPEEPNDAATIVTEDGSSPRSRPLPSFSMPNTQTRAPEPTEDQRPREPANHSVAAQDLPPSPTGLRPLAMDNYRALETQLSEPKPLPGERHVLRPIIRAKAAASPIARESEFPQKSESIWDTPMPGVKRESPFPTGPSPTPPTTPTPTSEGTGPEPSSTSDPLFVQVGASTGPSGRVVGQDGQVTPRQFRPESQIVSTPSTAPIRSAGRPRPQSGDYIWHVIQQNQSLESISFQYRGDGSLVAQLLELNRDRLTDPQLLPIGKAIRIPIR